MIRLLKWVYKLGYDRAWDSMLTLLEKEAAFHNSQSQIKGLQEHNSKITSNEKSKITAHDHNQRYEEVCAIQNRIDPVKYPDLKSYMELLL